MAGQRYRTTVAVVEEMADATKAVADGENKKRKKKRTRPEPAEATNNSRPKSGERKEIRKRRNGNKDAKRESVKDRRAPVTGTTTETAPAAVMKRPRLKRNEDGGEQEKVKVDKRDPAREQRTVFVGNVSSTVTKKDIKKLFNQNLTPDEAKNGEGSLAVETIRVRGVAPRQPGMPKRVAAITGDLHPDRNTVNMYVVLRERSLADKAVASLNGEKVDGRHLRVDYSSQPATQRASKGEPAPKAHDHRRSVFLGNLPFDVDEEVVRQAFDEGDGLQGRVESVRVVRDASTGLGRGFGYVLMTDPESVGVAMSLSGQLKVGDRVIRLERSKDVIAAEKKTTKSTQKKARPKNKTERKQKPFTGAIAKPRGFRKDKAPAKGSAGSTRRKRAEAAGAPLLSKKEKLEKKQKKLRHTIAKQNRREGKREK